MKQKHKMIDNDYFDNTSGFDKHSADRLAGLISENNNLRLKIKTIVSTKDVDYLNNEESF